MFWREGSWAEVPFSLAMRQSIRKTNNFEKEKQHIHCTIWKTVLFDSQEKRRYFSFKYSEKIFSNDCNWIQILLPTGKTPHHPPVFDGTDKTVPKNLKDKSVINDIQQINEGKMVFSSK